MLIFAMSSVLYCNSGAFVAEDLHGSLGARQPRWLDEAMTCRCSS